MGEFPEVNVRSSHYAIARTRARCGNCGMLATVVALVVPPGHEVLDSDSETPEARVPVWQTAAHGAFLFHIDYLPDAIGARLGVLTRFSQDGSGDWSNHCECCAWRLEDQDLFCEPESAFFPVCEPAARQIHLTPVDEPLEAAAAGYFPDPEFFDAMSWD